jgi:hypothetical protein
MPSPTGPSKPTLQPLGNQLIWRLVVAVLDRQIRHGTSIQSCAMFITVYDSARLISFSIHVGDALTEQELDAAVAIILKSAAEAAARNEPLAAVVLVETDNTLNASQRRRLADASSNIQVGYQAIVTASVVARAAMTAIAWLRPSTAGFQQSVHATYEDARARLVQRTKHSAEVFDVIHAHVRRRLAAALSSADRRAVAPRGA